MLFAEFVGTFTLVLAGCGAIVVNEVSGGAVTHPGVALVFGLVVLAMIDAFGDISGAHINPAVTIAFAAAGRFRWGRVAPYVLVQCLGAIAACYFVAEVITPERESLLGATVARTVDGDFREAESWAVEFALTAILMLVILRVATGSKERGLAAGVTIGAVIAFEAMAFGPISGASMNPARSLGPAAAAVLTQEMSVAKVAVESLWIYLTSTTAGAVTAAVLWRFVFEGPGPLDEPA